MQKKRHGGGSKYNIKNDPTWQQAYKSIELFKLNRHEFAHDKSICFSSMKKSDVPNNLTITSRPTKSKTGLMLRGAGFR